MGKGALLIIDMSPGFLKPAFCQKDAYNVLMDAHKDLLAYGKQNELLTVFVEQYPVNDSSYDKQEMNRTLPELIDSAENYIHFVKHGNSAFGVYQRKTEQDLKSTDMIYFQPSLNVAGITLEQILKKRGVTRLLAGGVNTSACFIDSIKHGRDAGLHFVSYESLIADFIAGQDYELESELSPADGGLISDLKMLELTAKEDLSNWKVLLPNKELAIKYFESLDKLRTRFGFS